MYIYIYRLMIDLFHGTFPSKMDDNWGYTYDSGNLHVLRSRCRSEDRQQSGQQQPNGE